MTVLTSDETLGKCLHLSSSQTKWQGCGEAGRTPSHPPQQARTHALHSLLHDFPSLPRLKPERQRQVRALWLLASRQMSEQPPGFPYWSFSQAWLLTRAGWRAGQDPRGCLCARACRRLPAVCPHPLLLRSSCPSSHLRTSKPRPGAPLSHHNPAILVGAATARERPPAAHARGSSSRPPPPQEGREEHSMS